MVTAASGSKSDTKYYACFAANGHARIKSGTGTKTSGNNSGAGSEGFFTSSTFCGADGKTAASGAQSGKGWSKFNSGSTGAVTAVTGNAGAPAAANRLGIFGTVNTCACGTAGTIPTDGCAGLASADVKTKCTATSDGGTPAKKCCLATFAAVPTTPVEGTNANDIAVVTPTKGGKVDGSKYYACYKSASGKIRFKTAATSEADDGVSVEAWADATLFCATAAVGKA